MNVGDLRSALVGLKDEKLVIISSRGTSSFFHAIKSVEETTLSYGQLLCGDDAVPVVVIHTK